VSYFCLSAITWWYWKLVWYISVVRHSVRKDSEAERKVSRIISCGSHSVTWWHRQQDHECQVQNVVHAVCLLMHSYIFISFCLSVSLFPQPVYLSFADAVVLSKHSPVGERHQRLLVLEPCQFGTNVLFTRRAREICVSMWCTIVLIGARCQLDEVSVCCDVSVGLVQGCEWHWRISGRPLYGTSCLSGDSMQFLQTPTQAHSLSIRDVLDFNRSPASMTFKLQYC